MENPTVNPKLLSPADLKDGMQKLHPQTIFRFIEDELSTTFCVFQALLSTLYLGYIGPRIMGTLAVVGGSRFSSSHHFLDLASRPFHFHESANQSTKLRVKVWPCQPYTHPVIRSRRSQNTEPPGMFRLPMLHP